MSIQAVSNKIFVRWLKEIPKSSTIIIPERAEPDSDGIRKCEVVSVGPLVTCVKPGDTVLVGMWACPWFKYEGDDCSVVKEIDCMGVCDE